MRNFFSFGNVPQVFDFTETDIALVLGQNNDITEGGEGNRRNGVGKSAMVQGLVYALFGKSIGNSIKVQNLVNKTNEKGMQVELHFTRDSQFYVVKRGRSPNYFHFYEVDKDGEKLSDDTRGESDSTQEELEEVLHISQSLFEQIVVQNTSVEPFLKLSAAKQREMIEELLGLTELTEKAQQLKDMAKESRRLADHEKMRNDTFAASNERILNTVSTLEQSSTAFETKKASEIGSFSSELELFTGIDLQEMMDQALELERIRKHNSERETKLNNLVVLSDKKDKFEQGIVAEKAKILAELEKLQTLDIDAELELHKHNDAIRELKSLKLQNTSKISVLEREQQNFQNQGLILRTKISTLIRNLAEMQESTCPSCKQEVPCTDDHLKRIQDVQAEIAKLEEDANVANVNFNAKQDEINAVEVIEIPEFVKTFYDFESEAKLHQHKMQELQKSYAGEKVNPYDKDIDEAVVALDNHHEIVEPSVLYSTSEVQALKFQKQNLESSLQRAQDSVNPYTSQIEALLSTGIQEVNYDEYDRLQRVADHEEFLSKLLMNKDSHVRKNIIEQSIPFLNSRLVHYITESGSQHQVQFQNDLSVEILHMGREYDFSQLSRGERARVIISLNNAFRDTYESLSQSINLCIVDELIDDGMDSSGVECAWRTLYDMAVGRSKNVCVVSHREELRNKAENIILVVRENGFSQVTRAKSYDL